MRGDLITILTLSRGVNGGEAQARMNESLMTAGVLGARLIMGDLADGRIDADVETIRIIEEAIAVADPTVVYGHSPHDNHQDHRAVAAATTSAARGVRRLFSYQAPSANDSFRPTRFVAIDSTIDRKVELLAMFNSQHGRSYLEPELIVASSRYWARHLGVNARYAEPFEVIRSVGDLRHAESTPSGFVEPLSWAPVERSYVPITELSGAGV
jgi:LmbE family N-acetylglucosaminyl deacetylase